MASDSFPITGRIAAIDYGSVRIGIAICDPDRILASPFEMRPAENWEDDAEYYRGLTKIERVTAFIVGLPIHCDGKESEKSKEARSFAKWLREECEVPVRMFDERFTTADANRRLAGVGYTRKKKKARLDAVAALVMLESFIEACQYRGGIAGTAIEVQSGEDEALEDTRGTQ